MGLTPPQTPNMWNNRKINSIKTTGISDNIRDSLKRSHKKFLLSLFGKEDVIFEKEELFIYGTDASKEFFWPHVVVRPSCPEQVKELLRWANSEKIPIIPRARATNVVGACVPIYGGVVVSTLKLNKILDIDEEDSVVEVEPGVVTGELQKVLKKRSLFYPPDPASANISTIGGNVAQNAGGLKAVKYGVTKDYVMGMDVYIPGGKKLSLGGRCHKDVVGLDLKSLMIGSEGTLGFFTKIILKILPLPEQSISLFVGFDSLNELTLFAMGVFKKGLIPVAMEFMDKDVVECVKKIKKTDFLEKVNNILILQFDGSSAAVRDCVKKCEELVKELKVVFYYIGGDIETEEKIWDIRRMINPASHQLGEKKIALDICVPRSKIPSTIEDAKEIGKRFDIPVLCFGHLGDGNIHVNLMYNKGGEHMAYKASQEILVTTIKKGGTVSGEHGVGLVKKDSMKMQISHGPRMLMKRIKQIFDPNNIMNPGKAY